MREIEEKMAAANAKYKARREVKKTKGNATALEAIYHDAVSEHHPEAPRIPWRVKDLGSMKRAFTRVVPTDEWRKVLTFIVKEWEYIRTVEFKWMKNLPETPHVPVIVSHLDKLYLLHVSLAAGNKSLSQQAERKRAGETATAEKLSRAEEQLRAQQSELQQAKDEIQKLKRRQTAAAPKANRVRIRKPGQSGSGGLRGWDE